MKKLRSREINHDLPEVTQLGTGGAGTWRQAGEMKAPAHCSPLPWLAQPVCQGGSTPGGPLGRVSFGGRRRGRRGLCGEKGEQKTAGWLVSGGFFFLPWISLQGQEVSIIQETFYPLRSQAGERSLAWEERQAGVKAWVDVGPSGWETPLGTWPAHLSLNPTSTTCWLWPSTTHFPLWASVSSFTYWN